MYKNEINYTYKKDKSKIYIGLMKYLVFFTVFDWKCLSMLKVKSKDWFNGSKRDNKY